MIDTKFNIIANHYNIEELVGCLCQAKEEKVRQLTKSKEANPVRTKRR